ncbi:MAG: VWA domain-containing protein [Labilithrix sp.]|nr:VWA domain-containing protein [Labilithrix sp.]
MMRAGLFGTEGGAVALLGVEVRADVVAGHAAAIVRQRYRNDEAKPIEAVYTFPLPTKAVLVGFSMTVEGRRMEGEVHEREEAFRRYDDAVAAGHGGALLEQERPNVFTANVGNLLPGEETILEIQYVEPLLADEGAVRWSVPTLVAPRYIPGRPGGDRTAHGVADPTDRVPDADRISPPIGAVAYGLALDLTFDLGVALEVESPSHAVVVAHEGGKARVTFSQREVPLDRDVVVTAFARSGERTAAPIASAVTHRAPGREGVLALTLVPDLGASQSRRSSRSDVVFVLDRSGSMAGASMPEARTALRLCLRQLREGDRFAILAFDDSVEAFAPELLPFTQATLERADAWLAAVDARGGTELLAPMQEAARLAPDGVVVLLTDGEVGNEDEILAAFLAAQRPPRVYSFGIGTNVSDALLAALADKTGGAVEKIHPGERVDDKVVAQFARATAPRVTELRVATRGIELGEMAPAEPRALVDSEPFCLFATYEVAGRGVIELRGKLDGEPFLLEVPVDLEEASDRPVVAKLWAQARIRDLERAIVTGRRADAMKDRITRLATTYGVSSKFTSFVVVEKRTGDRRANAQPETRVVPVNAPAGWALFQAPQGRRRQMFATAGPPPMPAAMPAPRRAGGAMPASPMAAMPPLAPSPMSPAPPAARAAPPRSDGGRVTGAPPPGAVLGESFADAESFAVAPVDQLRSVGGASKGELGRAPSEGAIATRAGDDAAVLAILSRQNAAGMWGAPGRDDVSVTVEVLLGLVRLGLSTAHAVHGAQLKKAVDALLARLRDAAVTARERELALGVAWLLASGRRTRHAIEDAARTGGADLAALSALLGDEPAVRARLDLLAPAP